MVSVDDVADRSPRPLSDGEEVCLGTHTVKWLDTPHLPHAWECGFLMERATGTLLCGDLFTQPGDARQPVTEGDILGPSEAFRGQMDYFSHTRDAARLIEKLAAEKPGVLACMHGSTWVGDGASLLRELGERLEA